MGRRHKDMGGQSKRRAGKALKVRGGGSLEKDVEKEEDSAAEGAGRVGWSTGWCGP